MGRTLVEIRSSAVNDLVGAAMPQSEGSWAWIGNHNPASTSSYTNWLSGRPNIASGGCARIFSLYSGVPNKWDDHTCDTTGPYVCYSPYS